MLHMIRMVMIIGGHLVEFFWGAIIIQCKITRRSFAPTPPSHTQVKFITIKNIDMFKLYLKNTK
jgi:hypothetical protein